MTRLADDATRVKLDRWLKIEEAARYLNVSVRWLEVQVAARTIPHSRLGTGKRQMVRFSPANIRAIERSSDAWTVDELARERAARRRAS